MSPVRCWGDLLINGDGRALGQWRSYSTTKFSVMTIVSSRAQFLTEQSERRETPHISFCITHGNSPSEHVKLSALEQLFWIS
jgi:hypothetical protein